MKAVYGKIDPFRNFYTFELFGIDFMIDSNFKVHRKNIFFFFFFL